MATVSDRPARAKRTPRRPGPTVPPERTAPRDPVATSIDRIPEGWQPGGKHPSRSAAPASAPAPAPARHGTCRLTLTIGENDYRLRPYPVAADTGLVAVWSLRKLAGPTPTSYAVASDGFEAHCTCPDHDINGAKCKHINALMALGLIPSDRTESEGGAQ